jgi:predicted secreted hydrolase
MVPKDEYTWSREGLRIMMPGLTWTGSARQMQVKASTPWGSLEARFRPAGPVLNYSGNGLIGLLGDVNYEYAFPAMRTVGTITAEGRTRRVSGVSWLDRQWGPLPLADPSMRWTWMNITLSGGDQLALWDILDNRAQDSWVTVLRPDGSYELAAVTPLAGGASEFWTSPLTRKIYPTCWRIDIPALGARLNVLVTGPRDQDGHVEATAAVSGRSKGRKVTGTTYVEMTGDWKAR